MPAIKITTWTAVDEDVHGGRASCAHSPWGRQDTHIRGPLHSSSVGSENLGGLEALLGSNPRFPFHRVASPLSEP